MRRIRVGDRVKAFLDARIIGEVVNIVYLQGKTALMVGGVPGSEAYADVRVADGTVVRVKMTDVFLDGI